MVHFQVIHTSSLALIKSFTHKRCDGYSILKISYYNGAEEAIKGPEMWVRSKGVSSFEVRKTSGQQFLENNTRRAISTEAGIVF